MSATFDWGTPQLDKAHLNAFANLLSLRDGGQVDSASLPGDVLADDRDDGWDVDSVDTNKADQISDSGHTRLKRKFLDCLAELAANKKDGKTVSCTAMKEVEDSVTIWITCNEGFSEKHKAVFDRLSLLLSRLSCGQDSTKMKAVQDLLWAEMVSYYQDRIQHDSIPNLRAAFKREDNLTRGKGTIKTHSVSASELSVLRKLVFDATAINHAKLVSCAYKLRTKKSTEGSLHDSLVEVAEKLWVEICLLARLRVGFNKFCEIASKLGSFNEVTIVLLPHPCKMLKRPENPLNLKQTLELLGLSMDSQTVKAMLGKSSISAVDRDFRRLQNNKIQVHAEVQMLLFLCTNYPSSHEVLPYLGCSKLSCFVCAHLLQFHSTFTTRGSHGRIFNQWRVPPTAELVPQQRERINHALENLQKVLKKELMGPRTEHRALQKTSVIGGSSIATDHCAEGPQRPSAITAWKLKAEQERVAEIFKRQTLDAKQPTSQTTTVRTLKESSQKMNECEICDQMTSRRCSICNRGFYCSESCQDQSSLYHLFKCGRRPITTADYLFMSLLEDEIPEEEDVLEDFGFNHLPSFADKSKLFGLYQGLMLSERVSPEEVHKWRVEGTLVANIKAFYYAIPERSRGGYFPWFINHTDILARQMSKEESTKLIVSKFFDKARPYMDSGDRNKDPMELKPEAKACAYKMLSEILNMAHPNPVEENWYAFGFCTCNDEMQERELGGLYQALLVDIELFDDVYSNLSFRTPERLKRQTATFTEFWQAFEAGRLIQLMDSKGLKDTRKCFKFLENFLSVPPSGSRPSVWYLKQFVAIADPGKFPPIASLKVDYGFMNCQTFEEICTLMEIYKRLFDKANPLALHEACLSGKLFEFAKKYDVMDEEHRSLMKNFYPLQEH